MGRVKIHGHMTKSVIYRAGCIPATDIWCQTLII